MDLALHYRSSKAPAEALQAELGAERPGSVLLLQADLHRFDALPDMIRQVEARFGRLDLLVNNASSFYPTPLESASEAEWDGPWSEGEFRSDIEFTRKRLTEGGVDWDRTELPHLEHLEFE